MTKLTKEAERKAKHKCNLLFGFVADPTISPWENAKKFWVKQ